jgi:hypothetical protein
MYERFGEWFDAFVEHVRILGYTGFIDADAFEMDYEEGADPYEVAEAFVEE